MNAVIDGNICDFRWLASGEGLIGEKNRRPCYSMSSKAVR
ncbi:Uncharacterised protein [Serratia fonticola]|uniref:Uncharacterized protein n=1 Tax=Serratia fonticola TaxID=47917 RepID=A0A4U9VNA0_SERFO|nr:Uncharacterised protein [Serratia fonticola]VTR48736.1 Uncharacterised protein [Serratia fonticola]